MALGKETTITIKRTVQTAPYESASVEITETYTFTREGDRTVAYKDLSTLVEKMANHEKKKYKVEK